MDMESIKNWEAALGALGLELKGIVAGAIGAFVSLNFTKNLNVWQRWTTFVGGWAIAAWGSRPIVEAFDLKPGISVGISLALGLFGMSLTAKLMQTIQETDWVGLAKTVLRLLRGGSSGGE